jgi:hypothetical protein
MVINIANKYIVFATSVAQQPHDYLQGGIDNVQPINIFRIDGNSTNHYAILLISARHNGSVDAANNGAVQSYHSH